MGLKVLSTNDVRQASVMALGLNSTKFDLSTVEVIACSLRRAAGFLCPCSANTLINAVVDPLRGLVGDLDKLRGTVKDTLEALVTYGDLFELSDMSQEESGKPRALLYLAPPAYVKRQSGAAIILGILPDNISLLPDEIEIQIEYLFHVRILPPGKDIGLVDQLEDFGFFELSSRAWLKVPKEETATEHLKRINLLLDTAPRAGDIPGLVLLDPGRSVRYYKGRWVEPTTHTGRYVGRRSQAYGADLWCYVEVKNGNPSRFIDLPLKRSTWRGCDEAWRIQAAIDYNQGTPQVFRVRPGPNGTEEIDFFSPLPMWVRRKWDAVGVPVESSGYRFSYRLRKNEIDEEIRFLKEYAWLTEIS